MSTNELKVINEKIAEYLKVKAQIKRLEEVAKSLKSDHIDTFADSVSDQFENNKYFLDQGVISLKNNPPKLVRESGLDLSKNDKAEFCKLIPQKYVVLSPLVPSINTNLNADKQLKRILKANGISVSQDSRYDVSAK